MSIKIFKSTLSPSPDPDSYNALGKNAKNYFPEYTEESNKLISSEWKTGGSVGDEMASSGNEISQEIFKTINPYETSLPQGDKERLAKIFIKNEGPDYLESPVVYLKSTSHNSLLSVTTLDEPGWYSGYGWYKLWSESEQRVISYSNVYYMFIENEGLFDDWTPHDERHDTRSDRYRHGKWASGKKHFDDWYHLPNESYDDTDTQHIDSPLPVLYPVDDNGIVIPPITEDTKDEYKNINAYLIKIDDGESGVIYATIYSPHDYNTVSAHLSGGIYDIASYKMKVFVLSDETWNYEYNQGGDGWAEGENSEYYLNYYKWEMSDLSHLVSPPVTQMIKTQADTGVILSSKAPVFPWARFYTDYVGWKVLSANIRYERVIWLTKEGQETSLMSNNVRVMGFDGDLPIFLFLVGGRDFNGIKDNVCYYTEMNYIQLKEYLEGNGEIDHIAKNDYSGQMIVFLDWGPFGRRYIPLLKNIPSDWDPIFIPEPYPYGTAPQVSSRSIQTLDVPGFENDWFRLENEKYEFVTERNFFYMMSNKKFNGMYIDVGQVGTCFCNNEDCDSYGATKERIPGRLCSSVICDFCGKPMSDYNPRFKITLEVYDNTNRRWTRLKDEDSYGDNAEFWDYTNCLSKSSHIRFSKNVDVSRVNLSKENPTEGNFVYPGMFRSMYILHGENIDEYLYCIRFNISVTDEFKDKGLGDFDASINEVSLMLRKDEFAPPGHDYEISLANDTSWVIQGDLPIDDTSWRSQTGLLKDGLFSDKLVAPGEYLPIWVKMRIRAGVESSSKNAIRVCVANRPGQIGPAYTDLNTVTPSTSIAQDFNFGFFDNNALGTQELQGIGTTFLRGANAIWLEVQPIHGDLPQYWEWDALDKKVSAASLGGIELMMNVFPHRNTPGGPITIFPDPWSYDNWVYFVKELVKRYKGVVKHWQFLDEPDSEEFWNPYDKNGNPISKEATLAMLHNKFYNAVKDEDPNAIVVMAGPTDVNNDSMAFYTTTFDYIISIRGDWLAPFDIFDFHFYRYKDSYQDLPGVQSYLSDLIRWKFVGTPSKPLMMSETGIWEGTVGDVTYTAKEQSAEILKRWAIASSRRIDRIGWRSIVDEFPPGGVETNHTLSGIIYRPDEQPEGDRRKYSWYVVNKMKEMLGGYVIDSVLKEDDVYAYRFANFNTQKYIWILWNDGSNLTEKFRIEDIGSPMKQTYVLPDYDGTFREEIIEYADPFEITINRQNPIYLEEYMS